MEACGPCPGLPLLQAPCREPGRWHWGLLVTALLAATQRSRRWRHLLLLNDPAPG